ncbi:MAG TPA: dihydrolipoamide acetyltransferase family protein [Candidatus Acidoferrales bacterium]
MAISVVMPALELTQETGKLVSWRKKEGEAVNKGETLLEVETDKAVVEVEALADGFLAGIKAQEGDVIPVGRTIAWIVEKGEAPPGDESPTAAAAIAAAKIAHPEEVKTASVPGEPSSAKAKISPKARRLAGELNVNLDSIKGSGPGGEILASDIESAAKSKSPTAAAPSSLATTKTETLTAIGRLMAERTTQSWTTVPHFFLVREVDATALNAAREKFAVSANGNSAVKITHTDLLTALVARVLLQHPRLNASYTPAGIQLHAAVNIAIAIAVHDGVIAAVIPNAHTASLAEIATHRKELAERAKSGKSRTQDLTGATFTISNLGMFHIDSFTAIIPPPQAAILAVGAIADRVVAVDGQPAVRSMMTMTLSSDHRVVDGAHGAQFLNDLVQAIANPQKYLG